ncbi:MAG TPA: DUF5615 family PIN-like protein [Saprospiraceae bacterium]|nr:DUF5615 family PIN-like protein [Saprospiraceae bacterium]
MLLIDAQLSPGLALWITNNFSLECYSVGYLGLRDATDFEIFQKARELNAIVLTKDEDFVKLLHQLGSPPKVIWLTCGNTSNARMRIIFERNLISAILLLETNDLVEING